MILYHTVGYYIISHTFPALVTSWEKAISEAEKMITLWKITGIMANLDVQNTANITLSLMCNETETAVECVSYVIYQAFCTRCNSWLMFN